MSLKPKRVLITGSRDWSDWGVIESALKAECDMSDNAIVVHGGAKGADSIAGHIANDMDLRVEIHPADWKTHGRAAGPTRNRQMVAAGADVCLAFPKGESRGTRGCMREAENAGIPVKVYEHAG